MRPPTITARLNRARQVDGAAEEQQFFRQRRLAGIGMRNDSEGSTTRNRVFRGAFPVSGNAKAMCNSPLSYALIWGKKRIQSQLEGASRGLFKRINERPQGIDVRALKTQMTERKAELERLVEAHHDDTHLVVLDQTTVGRLSRMDDLQTQAMSWKLNAAARTRCSASMPLVAHRRWRLWLLPDVRRRYREEAYRIGPGYTYLYWLREIDLSNNCGLL